MGVPGSSAPLLFAPTEQPAGYSIERSLRFNSSDSAYLSRTPASASNRKTWTWAAWVKRSGLSGFHTLFSAGSGGYFDGLFFNSSNQIYLSLSNAAVTGEQASLYSSAVYRDTGAWMHIVLGVDTTQSVASDRIKVWVNGLQVTNFASSSYPSQNADCTFFNTSTGHSVGRSITTGWYLSGYLADIHFIDGQALTPTSFGEFDVNNVWQPKAYTGTFTGNSFWLKFADNSAATATTLGKDSSGLGNNWTPNNLSIGSNGGPGGTITSVRVRDGAGADAGFSTIRVDGVVLVQGAGTPDYRSFVSATGPYIYGTSVANTFTSNLGEAYVGGGASITFAPSPGIAYSQSVEIWTGGDANNVVSFNNGAEVATGAYSWTLIAGSLPSQTDSLVDTPTSYGTGNSGGDVRGNFATFNPLASAGTFTNGNLDLDVPLSTDSSGLSTIGFPSSGKWYWETTIVTLGADSYIGISTGESRTSLGNSRYAYRIAGSFQGVPTPTSLPPTASAQASGDIVGVAYDVDNATLAFYKNGTLQGTITGVPANQYFALNYAYSTGTVAQRTINFGQRPFAYTAPSGFKALCDTNLPAPVVAKPSEVMDVALYTGNGSTQNITGLGFNPDLVWLKIRNQAGSHGLWDAIRGTSARLDSGSTGAEDSTVGVTAFNSDGFTVGGPYNSSSNTWVAWTWDAGSSTVTNTQGSITSQVRANASAGFSIVTWTGNGVGGATIGHGLNVAPSMIIIKQRDQADNWVVGHTSQGWSSVGFLNLTNAWGVISYFNNTAPLSTTFQVSGSAVVNRNGYQFVAYCFAPVAGYSSFGSYTGNGSADGPFVYTGFRPKWLLIKFSSGVNSWMMQDSARDIYNPCPLSLIANGFRAEEDYKSSLPNDMLSNGFKLRTANDAWNGNGGTYIYAAFAESPFQYARAR